MRKITLGGSIACSLLLALAASSASAQLYTEDFDDGNASSRWTAFPAYGGAVDTNFDTMPFTGVDGVIDDLTGFSYDYSVAGIPLAPNSAGTDTIGLKLQANLFSSTFGGFSVSPNGLNLTGDYSMKFDAWSSTLGPFPGGGNGSTNLSTFGILTAGDESSSAGSADGVFFGYTGDGGSSADFRGYSVEEQDSYNLADLTADPPVEAEANATYYALNSDGDPTRNAASSQLYLDAVGSGRTVPQSVQDAFAGQQDLSGTLGDGAAAFAWQENEIRKEGNIVDWYVNGIKLITIDTTTFTDDLGGGNISFGHSDINAGSSLDLLALDLLFTLIDNIEVTALTPTLDNADFDGSGLVDGADFLTLQQNFGTPDALPADGDANGDMMVDAGDLAIFQAQYGAAPAGAASVAGVPEPASWIALLMGVCLYLGFARPRPGLCAARAE